MESETEADGTNEERRRLGGANGVYTVRTRMLSGPTTQVAADIASVINSCRSGSKSKTPLTDEVERVPAPHTILSMVVA